MLAQFLLCVLVPFVAGQAHGDCFKNGKSYHYKERFTVGHLRYLCMELGQYMIEGCVGKDGNPMEVGDVRVAANVAFVCHRKGSSVSYKESICGVELGMPACEELSAKFKAMHSDSAPTAPIRTTDIIPTRVAVGEHVVHDLPSGSTTIGESRGGSTIITGLVRIIPAGGR